MIYKDDDSDEDELPKQLHNLREILLSTNATPIKRHTDRGYMCCFCDEKFKEPTHLKQHTLEQHDDKTRQTFMEKESIDKFLVKLDITSLKCCLCNEDIVDLDELSKHLADHGKTIYTDIKTYILPFKFVDDILRCAVCENLFTNFLPLHIHMASHFPNIECDICGAVFVNRSTWNAHYKYTHGTGSYACSYCPQVFETVYKKKNHEVEVHTHAQKHKCGYCDKRFKTYNPKRVHLKEEHDIQPALLECKICDKTFWKPSLLTLHVKKTHLMEKRFKCAHCDKAFYFEYLLNDHLIKHSSVKKFKCEICFKYFARRKSLREHIKLHADDRQYTCDYCDAAYIQKISLKNHFSSKHGVVD